jgi:BirA family transcriptional regulator, biotin operon repressor / biotin---[acetyl-CoA-carboxylase] ligase
VTDSPYADLDRPPLNERALGRALARDGGLWREIKVVPETGSTNADLAAAARDGAPEGMVLVAELQTAGKGRLGRAWQAPPRSGLTFSLLLRPQVPLTRLTWMPLLTGLAVALAVERMTSRAEAGDFGSAVGSKVVQTALKWPNDVLVGERKLAGILAERADEAMIVGVGLNVSLRQAELPTPTATSLTMENATFTDREPLLRAILREFERWYGEWRAADGDPEGSGLRAAYRSACATLGQVVRVELPGATDLRGTAYDIDTEGRLLVRVDGDVVRAVGAGDVVHVRAGG